MLDGEQPIDDRSVEAHTEVARQRDHRPVRELHVALGVGEQDAVDGRVEHRPQDVREPLEVDVLLRELPLMARQRSRHLVEGARELADFARATLGHLDAELPGCDILGGGGDAANRRDCGAQEIADDPGEQEDRDDDPGDADFDAASLCC